MLFGRRGRLALLVGLRRTRSRLRASERRADRLAAELSAERARNREREDHLVNGVVTAAGRYGLPPRAPEPEPAAHAEPSVQSADATHALGDLSAYDEAELEMYEEEAAAAGKTRADGRALWLKVKAGEPLPFEAASGEAPGLENFGEVL